MSAVRTRGWAQHSSRNQRAILTTFPVTLTLRIQWLAACPKWIIKRSRVSSVDQAYLHIQKCRRGNLQGRLCLIADTFHLQKQLTKCLRQITFYFILCLCTSLSFGFNLTFLRSVAKNCATCNLQVYISYTSGISHKRFDQHNMLLEPFLGNSIRIICY